MFVELVFFRSKVDTTIEAVLDSARKIQDLAIAMSSSFKIELLRTDEGEWVESFIGIAKKKPNVLNRQ